NLTQIQPIVVGNPTGLSFKYYETYQNAENEQNQITNPTAYSATNGTVVYLRVENAEGCFQIVEITLVLVEDCLPLEPMCADGEYGVNVPAIATGELSPNGPDYGCLFTQPNPTWYYFRIQESGSIVFDLNQYTQPDQQGQGIDVDFIVWGPFDAKPCSPFELSTDKIVDCSYSASSQEVVEILNAEAGKYYVLLITNYSQQNGYFNLIPRPDNTGSFDCTIMGDAQYSQCNDDQDGQVVFDLDEIAGEITAGNYILEVKFYSEIGRA